MPHRRKPGWQFVPAGPTLQYPTSLVHISTSRPFLWRTLLQSELAQLADYLSEQHEAILLAWRRAIHTDAQMTSGDALPRSELFDHIPSLLQAFERGIRGATDKSAQRADDEAQDEAAAHGLQRWQQGFDLRAVSREWGPL